jgi:hypothetical protein
MATKKELEEEVQRLTRELGKVEVDTGVASMNAFDTGVAQTSKAQGEMNASITAGRESGVETRSYRQQRRAKHQAALRGEVEQAVVVQYDQG